MITVYTVSQLLFITNSTPEYLVTIRKPFNQSQHNHDKLVISRQQLMSRRVKITAGKRRTARLFQLCGKVPSKTGTNQHEHSPCQKQQIQGGRTPAQRINWEVGNILDPHVMTISDPVVVPSQKPTTSILNVLAYNGTRGISPARHCNKTRFPSVRRSFSALVPSSFIVITYNRPV